MCVCAATMRAPRHEVLETVLEFDRRSFVQSATSFVSASWFAFLAGPNMLSLLGRAVWLHPVRTFGATSMFLIAVESVAIEA